jgi:ATP:corrinoid adenosyltransferase
LKNKADNLAKNERVTVNDNHVKQALEKAVKELNESKEAGMCVDDELGYMTKFLPETLTTKDIVEILLEYDGENHVGKMIGFVKKSCPENKTFDSKIVKQCVENYMN